MARTRCHWVESAVLPPGAWHVPAQAVMLPSSPHRTEKLITEAWSLPDSAAWELTQPDKGRVDTPPDGEVYFPLRAPDVESAESISSVEPSWLCQTPATLSQVGVGAPAA